MSGGNAFNEAFPQSLMKGCIDYMMRSNNFLASRFILPLLAILAFGLLLATQPVFAQSSPPGAPTGLTATAVGTTTAELSWTAPSSGRDSVTGYKIEHSTDNGGLWTAAGSVPDTEAAGTQNVDVSGVQTYYSVTAVAGANLYRVSAINAAGTGDPSGRVSVTPPVDEAQPDAPTGVTATANGSTEINLSWTAGNAGASSITGYKIEYSKNNLLPWMDVGTTTVTTNDDGTKYSDTGLDPDTTRHYRVSAMNVVGRGPVSSTSETDNPHMATTTLAGVPAAPTSVMATAVGGTRVELSWTAPNEGRAPITGYRIETSNNDGGTWTASVLNTEPPDGDNTASGVQTHYAVTAMVGKNLYRVSAMNAIGMGLVSDSASVTPPVDGAQPDAPTAVAARPDGTSEIEVTWTAGDAGASSITGYKIEYSKNNLLPWMDIATVGNVLEYSNTGLAPGTTRYYRVSAINSIGRGPVSVTANGTDHMATTTTTRPSSVPGKPTGLTATAVGTTTAELSWTAPSSGRDSVTGYEIEHSTDNGGSWAAAGSVPDTEAVGTQNVDVSGVQTYYSVTAAAGVNLYRVSAINVTGTGDPSTPPVSVTPPVDEAQPDAPTGVTATANGSTEINLSWTAGNAGASSITGYKIEYSKNNLLPWMDVGTTTVTTNDDGTKYSDTGLDPDTTRHYRVSAMSSAGRGPVSSISETDNPHMATTTLAGVPAAPTSVMATAVGGTRVELSWTAPNEGRAPITGYRIETSNNDGGTWTASVLNTEPPDGDNTASGVQTHYAVTAVVGKNLYRVSAMNAIGMGPVSDSASVTPPVVGQEPAVPTAVAARPDGTSEIEVTWTAGDAGASSITGYKIEYSKNNLLPWMDVATTTATRYEDTGLDPNTTRYYRVSAINVVGRGPVSSISETDNPHMATTAMGSADRMGMVTLSTQEPMVGTAITATLTDADSPTSAHEWQWEKSTNMSSWMDAMGTGAMTATYTPEMADEGYYLRATVTYTDANRSGRIAEETIGNAVAPGPASDADRLLAEYDDNADDRIDDDEIGDAIVDYVNGDLSPADMGAVIVLYLQ